MKKYGYMLFFLYFLFSCQQDAQEGKVGGAMGEVTADDQATIVARDIVLRNFKGFDFRDNLAVSDPEIGEQGLVNLLDEIRDSSKMVQQMVFFSLLGEISKTPFSRNHFTSLIIRYLDSPDSPLFSNHLYSSFLRARLSLPRRDAVLAQTDSALLELLSKNEEGSYASDFSYLRPDGSQGTLHGLEGRYTILIFFDPTCGHCQELFNRMSAEDSFTSLMRNMDISFLLVDPWGNYESWMDYQIRFPATWNTGFDQEKEIIAKSIYHLQAAPSIYLLDREKKVLMKNANLNGLIRFLLSRTDADQ